MRTTLKQIAEETHLSVTIVSQVLNDRECRVSEKNRQLIINTARKLNYRPNKVAVGLVKGSINTIGLAISDIRNDFFSLLAKSVEDECQRAGWNVILCNSNDKHSSDLSNIKMLADSGVSGVIFGMASESTAEMAQECINLMIQEHLPYLLVDRYITSDTGGIVCVDHVEGGHMATKYLLSRGYKKILCITGPNNLIDSEQRLEGYRKALSQFHVPYHDELVIEGKYTYESGEECISRVLEDQISFDAVFAFNDMMAIGAMKRLRENGIRIPEDIGVIGYDDIFMDSFLEVPLTTIKQPKEKMGRAAAQEIIRNHVDYKNNETRIIYKPTLVERQTVLDRT